MNHLFQEKKGSFFLLVILLFILSIVLYIFFVNPINAELKQEKTSLASLETEVQALEMKIENLESQKAELVELEKRVPLNPNLNLLLMSLQSVANDSSSNIDNIEFRYDGMLSELNSGEDVETIENEGTEEAEVEDNNNPPALMLEGSMPNELRLITASIDVVTSNYGNFMTFLKGLEQLDRISIVEGVRFTNSNENFTFTVELSTFYYGE